MWNPDERTDFYFGDVFFNSFVGIFNMDTNEVGFAKSSRAASSVSFECAGDSCAEPEPTPGPVPDDDIEPTP